MSETSVRPRILGVCGTSARDSRTRALLDVAMAAAEESGAEVRLLDLSATILPIMIEGDRAQGELPEVRLVRESAAWAQGFLLVSPEYHGSMSGVMKNWLDFLWGELAGKVAGVLAVTTTGHAEKAIHAIKTCFQWCHGWTLPFHAAAQAGDFTGDKLVGDRVRDRAARIGHDIARYAPLLHATFEAARTGGSEPTSGFGGFHARS